MSEHGQYGLIGRATIMCAAVLALPSILNGAPFLYFDSAAYIGQGGKAVAATFPFWAWQDQFFPFLGNSSTNIGPVVDEADKLVVGGRSVYYGALAYFSYVAGNVWPLIALQCLVVAWLIVTLMRLTLPGAWALPTVLSVMGLTVLTSVAFFAGLVLPDIWAGCLILAVALLVVYRERLSVPEHVALLAVVTFSVLSHIGHLLLLAAMTGVGLLGWLVLSRVRQTVPLTTLTVLSFCVAVGIAGQVWFALTVEKVYGAPPISRPFVTAHLIDLGPGSAYAKSACPEAKFAICDYTDRLPMNWVLFLFSHDPDVGVFGSAPPGVKRSLSAEQFNFAAGTIKADPVGTLGGLAFDALAQLWHLSIDDVPMIKARDKFLSSNFPPELTDMTRESWLYSHAEEMHKLTALIYASTVISSVVLVVLLLLAGPRSAFPSLQDGIATKLVAFIAICLAGVVLNALIFGILASPYGRFQARIVWIVPLLSVLTVTSLLKFRSRFALNFGKTS